MSDVAGTTTTAHVEQMWTSDVMPTLCEFIRIPNMSPAFEPDWESLGHIERAVLLLADWCQSRPIEGMKFEIHRLAGRTPVLFMEIPPANGGAGDDTVLLYGHLDKQPEMVGWRDGLGPWTPVLEDDRLYGRGAADDGYSVFASLCAIEAARAAGYAHTRLVVLIEASEESGSVDLPDHVAELAHRIGTPSLVVCLDSGCMDYEHLWISVSLRGLLAGRLEVKVTTEGVHSGDGSGVIPSSFRIARDLLNRIEDSATGDILLPECQVSIPADRLEEIVATTLAMPTPVSSVMPFLPGVCAVTDDAAQQIINRTWRPMLEITGADGLPPTTRAGNVLRPETALYLSLRLPPTADPSVAEAALTKALTDDSPYGAHVTYRADKYSPGWNAPTFESWLWHSVNRASELAFGTRAHTFGEGGTIPFMAMLGHRFPDAQFVVTGVLGPESNAHGPNEFLHIPTAKRLTVALAEILRDHAARPR